MINGTEDLNTAILSLTKLVKLVEEEQWSVDYTHDTAPETGKIFANSMSVNELQSFAADISQSTLESDENAEKIIEIMRMTTAILDHYTKLSVIGRVWKNDITNAVDNLRGYQ